MTIRITQVDSFTRRAFAGNPAGVCILDGPGDETWMRDVAREMNLSETAFLHPERDGYRLRWFTPAVEVNLCGHATLASAHVLWEEGRLPPTETARFYTRSGLLTAQRSPDSLIEMDFPADEETPVPSPEGLEEALGIRAEYVGVGSEDHVVLVESEEAVRSISPDFTRLVRCTKRGVIVTAPSSSEYDFVSRFFAPAAGVDEDPVTGSAHCLLGPFWRKRLKKDRFVAHQASRRGGTVYVAVKGDRVMLGGYAVTTLRGEIVGE